MRLYKPTKDQLESNVRYVIAQLVSGVRKVTIDINTILKLPKNHRIPKIEISFSDTAWSKINAIVNYYDKELAWHGTVERTDKGLYVKDIYVYPQLVTSTTVESDEDKYPAWLDQLPDDVFNSIRLQGHSHVNMGVSPSAVDEDFYETLIKHLNDYYIYMIINKRGDLWFNVYDLESNLIYEKEDIVYNIPSNSLASWVGQVVDEMIDEAIPAKSKYPNPYGYMDAHYETWPRSQSKSKYRR